MDGGVESLREPCVAKGGRMGMERFSGGVAAADASATAS
jgi:hypothetical protein